MVRKITDRFSAGRYRLGRVRRKRGRDLRRDQESCKDGGYAYQSEKLVQGKHCYRPPKAKQYRKNRSIAPLRGLLVAGQKLVGVGRPGNREQRQNRNDG